VTRRQAQKPIRDIVRETFTPPRVGLLSWAFAAVFMGTVGLASYQFSYQQTAFQPAAPAAGLALPPAGDVNTTASIPALPGSPEGVTLEVMQLPLHQSAPRDPQLGIAQMEVLQREIVGLRRRLSALSEQNLTYSRRIAALEKQVAVAKLAGQAAPTASSDTTAEPGSGVVITRAAPETQTDHSGPAAPADVADKTGSATGQPSDGTATPSEVAQRSSDEAPKAPPRLISIYRNGAETTSETAVLLDPDEPVRIVERARTILPPVTLPDATDPPLATGSIPQQDQTGPIEPFNATPTPTTLRPKVITPSSPAGRLRGGGSDSQLKRSDFGAIIGHYITSAGAAKAWADFKAQNVERMRDLRPLLMQRQTEEGGIALMVGPFANAADAAVACLHLLDVTELCHPALYAGDPLVTAAEFRDNAF